MSALSWFVLIFGGLVATIATVAISFVIVSTLVQASVLLFKWLTGANRTQGEGTALSS